MTWLVVRLRFTMWRTAMARSSLQLTSSIIGGLVALGVVAVLGPAIAALALRPLRLTALTVPLFATFTLMWVVLSLVASGVDNVLDPARFTVLPLRADELARGLLAAAYTGIPALMLSLLALAQVVAWGGHPVALPAALLAAVLGTLTAVLASRAVTSALARVMTSRGGRVLGAAVVSLVTLLPLALNLVLTTRGIGLDLGGFDAGASARVAAWTPVGWAWGLPYDVAGGHWGTALVHLVLALVLVAVLWRVWVRQLGITLTSPMTSSGGQRIGRGRLLPLLLGRSPTAAVAARRVRAWYRDSRLVGIALRTAVLPVFFIVQAVITDTGGMAGAGVVTLAVFAGLTLMNDLAFDGPAWWVHVSTGLRGWEDRLGRATASAVVFGPGPRADLRRVRAARSHHRRRALAQRRPRRVPREPRPRRRGGCGAARHRAAHRGQPVRRVLRWGRPGLPHGRDLLRRAVPARAAGRRGGRGDGPQPARPVGGPRRRHRVRGRPARRRRRPRRTAAGPPGPRDARPAGPRPDLTRRSLATVPDGGTRHLAG